MKYIVTHYSPDQDAVCSIWLVKRFIPGYQDAEVKFVPAGSTLNNQPPDEDPNITHVDTGLGRFDHHQTPDRTKCAASLVLAEITQHRYVKPGVKLEALTKLAGVVLEVDHAADKLWPDPLHDRWEFMLEAMLDGLKYHKDIYPELEIVRFGLEALDGIFWQMQSKVISGKILDLGETFTTRWGQGISIETSQDGVMTVGERMGYAIVVRKDPRLGFVRVYAHPGFPIDLTPVYDVVRAKDPQSDWFLHASKRLLLNGSSKNPTMTATKLTLKAVVEIIRGVPA